MQRVTPQEILILWLQKSWTLEQTDRDGTPQGDRSQTLLANRSKFQADEDGTSQTGRTSELQTEGNGTPQGKRSWTPLTDGNPEAQVLVQGQVKGWALVSGLLQHGQVWRSK